MKSAYSSAMADLREIREKNKFLTQANRYTVYANIPRILEIEQELIQQGLALSRCVLEKGAGFDEVKKKIIELQEEKKFLLVKNGFEENFMDEIKNCEKCSDTGFIAEKKCECLKTLIIKNLAINANLSELMKNQTFEEFNFSLFSPHEVVTGNVSAFDYIHSAFEIALHFSENFENEKSNLLILGSTGTGKTYFSSCIANRALERGVSVYYQTAYKLFDMFDAIKFGKTGMNDARELIDYIYSVDLLIIDDLGTEFVTALSTSSFFDLVNSRLLTKQSTVINTNLSLKELDAIYSPRVVSRFNGEYQMLKLLGKDLR